MTSLKIGNVVQHRDKTIGTVVEIAKNGRWDYKIKWGDQTGYHMMKNITKIKGKYNGKI